MLTLCVHLCSLCIRRMATEVQPAFLFTSKLRDSIDIAGEQYTKVGSAYDHTLLSIQSPTGPSMRCSLYYVLANIVFVRKAKPK